ncbi:MAG TPA: DUF4136 domain-containing protein [Cyclobacteriaceae bacterium]|nr:DUF4136 domain-containing protein [Cyclobacteriaceae bacterium]
MKNANVYLILIAVLISSCFSQRDFVAEYDYSYRGNFKRYQTFGFVEETGRDPSSNQPVIEKTIVSRLGSQGFRLRENNPDMLITYKLFFDKVKYRGYVQPDFDMWLQKKGIELAELIEEDSTEMAEENREAGEDYNKVKYKENEGMLVVFVIDKRGNTIWQGYTSASFDYYSPNLSVDLARATYRIMDQFRIVIDASN